ncbi:hypothetical protein F53441_5873 [Fusarium austroafricanum]|uniref:Uncharacterized protein n=1 Tax=Fusarium austroafricanum TaxID=2364996 RepID=A0A8H4KKX4_9HYPO|nr:hypothetical protein F53441_5873 [Fusarium austroafricanum]
MKGVGQPRGADKRPIPGLQRLTINGTETTLLPTWITEDELLVSQALYIPNQEGEGMHVMKHGAKTGFTQGVSNGIQSVTRNPGGVSQECCILRVDGAFSVDGDSVSGIFDSFGRVGTMLTGGLDGDQPNATYVTPMPLLDEAEEGYDMELV